MIIIVTIKVFPVKSFLPKWQYPNKPQSLTDIHLFLEKNSSREFMQIRELFLFPDLICSCERARGQACMWGKPSCACAHTHLPHSRGQRWHLYCGSDPLIRFGNPERCRVGAPLPHANTRVRAHVRAVPANKRPLVSFCFWFKTFL